MTPLLAALAAAASEPLVAVPEPTEQAVRLYRSGVAVWWIGQALIVLIPGAIAFSGLSARMRSLARLLGRKWLPTVAIYGALYVGLNGLLLMPWTYYTGFVRPIAYGLTPKTYTFDRWISDETRMIAVAAAMAFALLWMPYLALRKMPRLWPWAVTIGYIPVAFAVSFLLPIVVDPLFNTFGPMQDKALEARILAMADRAGIDGSRIFEADKSERTTAVNAYVKGFLGTKRIVLYDTLLAKLPERQVLFVVAHEMGHYVLGHVTRAIVAGTIGVLILTLSLRSLLGATIRRFGSRLGFDSPADVASLPLALALGNLIVLIGNPVGLAFSRYQEHEADRFALELTRDNHAGALSFVAIQKENKGYPRPGWLSILWRSTHPPLAERIAFCNVYRPWRAGRPGRYDALFRGPYP